MRGSKKVLIVAADPDLLLVLSKYFEGAGFNTTTTWNHLHAMKFVVSRSFDVVIFEDEGLTAGCGNLIAQVRLRRPTAVCIILRASDDSNTLKPDGPFCVLSKWNLKDVIDTARSRRISRRSVAYSAPTPTRARFGSV